MIGWTGRSTGGMPGDRRNGTEEIEREDIAPSAAIRSYGLSDAALSRRSSDDGAPEVARFEVTRNSVLHFGHCRDCPSAFG